MSGHVSGPIRGNQRGLPITLICCLLAGCGGVERAASDVLSSHGNFAGMAAADEPQSVLVGRDVLTSGGNAADAAVAMAFAMTVTLPSQVGLGSVGACLAYDHGQNMVDAIDFVPRPGASAEDQSGLAPGLPRGLFLLHAKYGRVRWDQLLAPAAAMAQHGVPASRAFMRQFAPISAAVLADPVGRAVFSRADGEPVAEGDLMRNPQLGTAIGRMALHGVGEFYNGAWAREFVVASRKAGGGFDESDLHGFAPQSRTPLAVTYGHDIAYFNPSPALGGTAEADAWTHLAGEGAYKDAAPDARTRLIADILARAGGSTASQASGSTAGASLVTVDADGSAVACQFTLNRAFGTGAMVSDFGTYLAAPTPDPEATLGSMIAVNPNSQDFRLAIAASGGVDGTQALIRAAAETLLADRPLPDAVAAAATGDTNNGVQAARCVTGRPDIERCVAATDPRGAGLAQTMAEK